MSKNIKYVEPSDYIPKEIRRKCKLGEFAEIEREIERTGVEIYEE